MTGAVAIEVDAVDKSFGATAAVREASLTVGRGELVALLGPSGSGKTTLLRIISGFEEPDAGTVSIGGRLVAGRGAWEEPERRRIGMVFQDGALFPHLTVGENVAFGHPRAGRVAECLELVGLAHRAGSHPHELSGGERQRVALARALAVEPEVVLMDEPFASLDAGLRAALGEEVAAILRRAGASALLVTHNQQEALSLADVVVLIREGRVAQAGAPAEVYARPSSRWVAEFLGPVGVVAGEVRRGSVETELGTFPAGGHPDGPVELVVRPESVAVAPLHGDPRAGPVPTPGPGGGAVAEATVATRAYEGHAQLLGLELAGGTRLPSRRPGAEPWRGGDRLRCWVEGPVVVVPAHDGTGSPVVPPTDDGGSPAAGV